jgi:hypothetical protein
VSRGGPNSCPSQPLDLSVSPSAMRAGRELACGRARFQVSNVKPRSARPYVGDRPARHGRVAAKLADAQGLEQACDWCVGPLVIRHGQVEALLDQPLLVMDVMPGRSDSVARCFSSRQCAKPFLKAWAQASPVTASSSRGVRGRPPLGLPTAAPKPASRAELTSSVQTSTVTLAGT